MIRFAHNVIDKAKNIKQLKDTIAKNREFFPDAPAYIAFFSNDKEYKLDLSSLENVKTRYGGPNTGHKAGCFNGMFTAMHLAFDDSKDGDIVIFSHEDVSIQRIDLLQPYLKKLQDGAYSIIVRKPAWIDESTYIMFDTLLIRIGDDTRGMFNSMQWLNNEKELPFFGSSYCPEMNFGKYLYKRLFIKPGAILEIPYPAPTWGKQNHGFYHIGGREDYK